ncbi:hypothetical protein SGM_5929 [Streptomyces griseoaurantiacus M045]|uniref:Uncharacterized protein n=1 Tax=Streptomyces griseoaurantiacus M045 TaxID=996637 RepID=F3NS15_9ACTN|nr:hypothetical protein SGM_5929 [Streptomyces griseoaurantiacus M045]
MGGVLLALPVAPPAAGAGVAGVAGRAVDAGGGVPRPLPAWAEAAPMTAIVTTVFSASLPLIPMWPLPL